MTKLIGLFSNQKKAEEAVNALSAADLNDVDFQTILQWDEKQEQEARVAPAGFSGTAGFSGSPVGVGHLPSWDMDEEEEQFFKRTVERGGALVVVDVDDEDQVPQVNRILQESSEKVATSS